MIYNTEEITILREGGQKLAQVLREVEDKIRPGITTADLDALAHKRIRDFGGVPSFLGYTRVLVSTPFPSTLCTSINGEVVHAPASPARTLRSGDIVGLDIGMRYPADGGLCTDMAVTVGVGVISRQAANLIRVTREALALGIAQAKPKARVRDISRAIQKHVEDAGYNVVRELVGHGVGRQVHEEPEIPNFVVKGPIGDRILKPGLVIAIEPMVNLGAAAVRTKPDQWTVETRDRSLSAHFEHTIAITERGPVILTLP